MPIEIPPYGVADVVLTMHIAQRGHEFRDEATVYLEDNGRLREYKVPVKGHAAPETEE